MISDSELLDCGFQPHEFALTKYLHSRFEYDQNNDVWVKKR